jgi:glyoxylase-like metal-dependent hydrolase (beta-lactamase superfamily II)
MRPFFYLFHIPKASQTMKLIQDGVYLRTFMGLLNTYVLKTPEGVIIVDTALTGGQIHRLINELASIGISAQDVSAIFITHVHPDHVGGLPTLVNILPSSVKVITHRIEAPIGRGDAPMVNAKPEDVGFPFSVMASRMTTKNPFPARVDVEVSEGDRVGGIFEVVELPGHAYGQSGLWWPEKRLLIGGDVMMNIPMFGLTKPLRPATPDMPLAVKSIHKVAAMQVDTLTLGHGAPLQGNAHQQIQKFVDKLN